MKNILLVILFAITFCSTQNCFAQNKKSIYEELLKESQENIDHTIAHYHRLKKDNFSEYNFTDEYELNKLGYQLINEKRFDDAIKVFKLLIAEFPNSFNPYDSMGEAYSLAGKRQLAIENYEKSLALNPNNESAERFLMNIKFENRDKQKFTKKYPRKAYIDDLQELAKNLTTVNPHPYKFISKEEFWKEVAEKEALINDHTSYAEFIWYCSQIVANIGCGHSGLVYYFNQESEMMPDKLRFPLETRLINDKLYITDAYVNKNKLEAGMEIFSINGVSIEELKELIFPHIGSQGTSISPKRQIFNAYNTSYIPYALGFPTRFSIVVKGQKKPIVLESLSDYSPKRFESKRQDCNDALCFDILNENQTALIKIKHWDFYGNRISIFQDFIDGCFAKVQSENIQNVIIDVRGNGGGTSKAGMYFLQYLADQPFSYFKETAFNESVEALTPHKNNFKGDVYFLIDGKGGSTTGHVMAVAKHLNLGEIIGEELGSNGFCTGGQKMFSLSNTGVFYSIGRNTYVTDSGSVSDKRGVFPTHNVTQSIDEYLKDIDVELEYTLELIKQ